MARRRKSTGYVAAKIRANTARRNGLEDVDPRHLAALAYLSDEDLLNVAAEVPLGGSLHSMEYADRAKRLLIQRGWRPEEIEATLRGDLI
jgi:hypothetical protein